MSKDDEKRAQVTRQVENLSGDLLEMVRQLIDNLSRKIHGSCLVSDPLFTHEACDVFSMHILKHHAGSDRPLKKENFEYAFADTFNKLGHQVIDPKKQNSRGFDLGIDDWRLSLKTHGAQNLKSRTDKIVISKLMEARWIRDLEGADPRPKVKESLETHFQHYNRILMLRTYLGGVRTVCYDLIDIPMGLLLKAGEKEETEVVKSGQTISIWIIENGIKSCRIKLDGSVEKITVDNLSPNQCVPIASWVISL